MKILNALTRYTSTLTPFGAQLLSKISAWYVTIMSTYYVTSWRIESNITQNLIYSAIYQSTCMFFFQFSYKSGEYKRQRFRQLNFNKFLDACWCTFTVSIIYL